MENFAVARYQRFFGVYQQVKQGASDVYRSKITRFFGAYQQVKQDASDAYRSKIIQFMGQIAPCVQPQKEIRRKTAPHFNLFEALGITRKEQFQSRFLAFLLDPAESHDQEDMFLRTFLEHIQLLEGLPKRLDGAVVKTESGIAPYGRVDIAITLPDRRLIIIENKVDASEGEEQIARYQDWLRSQPQSTHGQHFLVFLTPEGRKPQTGDPDGVLPVSYRQLGDWVSSFLPELPEQLRIVLTQYGESCHVISGDRRYGMTTGYKLTNELQAFLTEPSNLDTALEVAEWVEVIRQGVFEQFWGRVRTQLSAELTGHGYQRQWEVYSDDIFAGWPKLGIYWKRRPNRTRRSYELQFGVGFAEITNKLDGDQAHYGIWRGKDIQAPAREVRDQTLSDQLSAENLVIDAADCDWWVGWRYLRDLDLLDFCVEKKEDVLRVNNDNHAPDHPLAHKLASLLWDLFAKYREALEDLNANYPY